MTTTSTYLLVENNLSRYQTMTSDEPAVQSAGAYYAANIGKVTSVSDFVSNYRLLSYALDAYGLGDQINSKALITQVLEGGVANSKSLANTLSDSRWKAFAAAFDFGDLGANTTSVISSSSSIKTTENNYVEQQLESDQGQQDVGVQLALYFQRVAPTVTNAYGILADSNLLEVVQTIFGISPNTSAENIDAQAAQISKLLPISELQDPTKLKQLTERFTAMYDLEYGPSSGATTSLSVTGDSGSSSSSTSAASSILSGVITANGQAISAALNSSSSPTLLFSNSLLQSLQAFKLGG